MADSTTFHIAENSPEQVAYKMADKVLIDIERKSWDSITRQEYLDTYADCLNAVQGRRSPSPVASAPAARRGG